MSVSGGRHPVMEIQEGVTYIANEYLMDRTSSRFHIITG
jgi:DNA mismatch repair ATPase MutS